MRLPRRRVLLGLAAALVAPPSVAAQPPAGVARVGLYMRARAWRDSISRELAERGWREGHTLALDWYPGELDEARLRARLAEHPADVLILGGPHRIRAAMRVAPTTPIIGLDLESDPVAEGFVQTLARPGGNVSGVWLDVPEIAGKQVQFLREALPGLARLGVVWDDRIGHPQLGEVRKVCRAAGIAVHPSALRIERDVDTVLGRLAAERAQAVLVLTAPVISHVLARIAEVLVQGRLPSISPFSTFPGLGGLMAYGPDFPAMWRQLAGYVDRVLRGARVGDLPVERPSKFGFIVNLRTAKELGLSLPRALVLRADEVIQ